MKNRKTYTTSILGRLVRFLGAMLMVTFIIPGAAFSQPAPVLDSPANLATNQSTTLVLKWFALAGDSIYHLQISTSIAFSTTLYNDSTLTGVSHQIAGLRNATKYYWRVSVKNGGVTSPYSTIRSFTTWNTTPVTLPLPVTLGLTGGFAILSYAGITNTGPTIITGNVGVSPLAGSYMSGFGTSNVVGTIYAVDASGPAGSIPFPSMLTQAMVDLTTAFNDAAGRTVSPIGVSGNLGGRTLYSGLYKSTGSLEITAGDLTLDAQGNVNAVWIFQIASGFNMTSGRQVFLSGGAKASNIFWQVGSAATFGTTCVMKGTIMAYTTITFATGASLEGRALSRTAAVTLQSNVIGGTANFSLSVELTSFTALIEGFYNGVTMIPDSVTVELHSAVSPYALVSSSKGLLNASGRGGFNFSGGIRGIAYYLVVKSRNSIETWSATPVSDSTYDFTSAQAQAYGNNLIKIGSKWCIYSGDVNQDGTIDGSDFSAVYNDVNNFVTGYTTTDLTGDGTVDGSDLSIFYNNINNFVGRAVPPGAPSAIRVSRPLIINHQQ
jgi:hypothetical protein